MARARTALVIGGGIAGSVAARALRKAGIEAEIFEAYASEATGVGGELMLAPNGLAALGVIDAAAAVEAVGIPTPRMVMETGTGKVLGEFRDLPGLPTSRLFARADLYRALADGLPVQYGKRLTGLVTEADGVTATFADGSTATADVLIGADGIRSSVRKLLDPHAPEPRYVGLLGFGAWVPPDGLPRTDGAMHFAFGRKAFFGYAVDDRHAGWFANLPMAAPMTAAEARQTPDEEWLRRIKEQYAEDTLPALAMIDRVRPGDLVSVGGMQDMPPVPVWHRGRAVLVGDAAHATSPSSGQGASLAIESAVELARCLRDLPVASAFEAYEGLRRARVETVIARTARINADKAPGPVGRLIRDLMFPLAMRTFYRPEKMMGWMHRYAIDWDEVVSPLPAESRG
jgi:2-polyprenyl-6-methoxyphenol hydroxylase-like FAD-dependent oxidoreductase